MSYKKQLKKMDKADLQFICRELGIVCNLNTKTRQQMISKILKPFNCFDLDDCKKRARNRMKRINKKKYKMWDNVDPNNLGGEMIRQLKLERKEKERKKREEERKKREEEERKKREEKINEICWKEQRNVRNLERDIIKEKKNINKGIGRPEYLSRLQYLLNRAKGKLNDCENLFDSMNFLP